MPVVKYKSQGLAVVSNGNGKMAKNDSFKAEIIGTMNGNLVPETWQVAAMKRSGKQ